MALADVEGAPVFLKQLTLAHHMASWQSTEEIIIRHYTRQFLHEMYKVIRLQYFSIFHYLSKSWDYRGE